MVLYIYLGDVFQLNKCLFCRPSLKQSDSVDDVAINIVNLYKTTFKSLL